MYGREIPKQRGIYSEILTTEDTVFLKEVSTFGPNKDNLQVVNQKQKMPRALGLKKRETGEAKELAVVQAAADSAENEKVLVGKNYFRDPQVNMGFYSKKREGVSDVDPKVMEPYAPIPGKPPRKVVIDRQRKLFASLDIEELLLELGIDYRNPTESPADWLPLEPFDDTEYDCRMPAEWVSYGQQEDGSHHPVPGKGLYKEEDRSGWWRPVLIHSYSEERQVYTGYWDGTTEYVELTRINLLFNAEDPRIFAQRVAQAHSERLYADSQIRYNFYIDFMPTTDLPELDNEQQSRILDLATRCSFLKKRGSADTESIKKEIEQDFKRTMNQIIMEKTLETPAHLRREMVPANLVLPPKAPPKEVPYFGLVEIPPHDFAEQFSSFCFHSLFIKEEVIRAMVEIRQECNYTLENNRIWKVIRDKTMRVDEFKQNQNASISQIRFNTRDSGGWVSKLEKYIRFNLNDVGKGWFNIQEAQKETYEFGKLKKFLTLVNFMQQDTVLNLCKESVHEFVSYILEYIPEESQIFSTSEVKNKFKVQHAIEEQESDTEEPVYPDDELKGIKETRAWAEKMFAKNKDPEPLFVLDLVLNAKSHSLIPQYSTNPTEIVEKIRDIFDDGVKSLQEIPQIEPTIMKLIYKSSGKKTIKAPIIPPERPTPPDPSDKKRQADENTWLWNAHETLLLNLQRAIKPLNEYVKTFEAFEEEFTLNPDKYVKGLDEGEEPISPESLRADIYKHMELEEELKKKIPESVIVSMFLVNCKEIRHQYTGKYATIVQKEIQLIATKAKEKNYSITSRFDEIASKISKPPKTIEELTDTKKFIADVGITIEKLKKEIDECMEIYQILDEFGFDAFSNSELNAKWQLFGAPKHVVSQMETQTQALDKLKDQMVKQMLQEQEDFDAAIQGLQHTVGGFHAFDNLDKYESNADAVDSIDAKIIQCLEQARIYNNRELLVGKETTDYTVLKQFAKDFEPYSLLWRTTRTWKKKSRSWKHDPWEELDAADLDAIFETSLKNINSVWRFFRDRDFPKILEIAVKVKAEIDEFKPYVPLAVALRKDGMKDRHWDQISAKVGFDIRPTEDFTLTSVIEAGMLKHVEIATEVGERASKEFHIEKSLTKMKKEWENQFFTLKQFKSTNTCFITGFEDAINMLDEHLVNTQAMQFSPFKKPFEEEINTWCTCLQTVQDTLEQWVLCQQSWMYLQPIFDSPDIMKQLPIETKRFKGVDIKWKYVINQAKEDGSILKNCSREGLKESFIEANKYLELVQKGLAEYLERKRGVFARFYFLSNDDLLEILSQTKEVRKVRNHLKKVFEAVDDLEFKPDDSMVAMMSGEGEKINFVRKVDPKDRNVEFWMGDVERQMVASVRDVFSKGLEDYATRIREDWVLIHPGQIVLNASQVYWTKEVEDALINRGYQGIKDYYDLLNLQRDRTVALVRRPMTKLARVSVNALIVIDVHALDVVGKLVENNISDHNAFEWVQQLRYYWQSFGDKEEENCIVKCVATVFPYGYEYLGNTGRLVITPLTDKCYMTLMGALQLNLGGAPAGPAGTGKTESTKDLAKALAKQCVVFNCSGDMEHTMVAKFFKGLAAAGAWCCFDEFNRINIEVLSVIAQYLLQLFGAKGRGDSEIIFEGSHIKMKPTFCVFITMNPGYAGRTELPDNLKALFRPVAMMVPDYAMIGEIMLYSFGFVQGRELAKKMVATFKLSSEQLSSQDHYDYGMRAVRSVINAAGLLKADYPDMDENQLLLRALRDVNVPKFLIDDLPLFENIILDLFPGVKRPEQSYGNLLKQMNIVCDRLNLQNVPNFQLKVIQLYDTIQVRHGLMLVGPTGGGKSSNYRVLQAAISDLKHEELFDKVWVDILNPKSITMGQLYGFLDPQTQEWQDGVLAKLVAECARDTSPDKHWVMFDGPVDALWIENMNTVLDDNKKLCLNSGQIINLTPRMTMMFEVEDLAVASPATVSRCGMVYMEPESLTLDPLITSWLNAMPPKVKAHAAIVKILTDLFADTLDAGCYFVRKNCPELVKTVNNNLAQSCMRILDTYMAEFFETETKRVSNDSVEKLFANIKSVYFFSAIWSLGATTTSIGRERFDKWCREKMKKWDLEFPEEKTVYDYMYSCEDKEWQLWFETIPTFEVDIKMSFNEIVVPTADSIRMKYVLRRLVMTNKHVLMPGPTGTGKSVYVSQLVVYEMPEEYQCLAMTFSAQTSANQTQDYLDDKMEKRRTKVYGPPIGKKYITFIDDLNMPAKEEFGAQPPIELLRQFLDHGGWYERNNKEKPFNTIQDMILVSAMGPPGGGRSQVTQRMQRHFNILTYTDMSFDAISTIFTTITTAFFFNFSQEIKDSIENLIEAQLEVYDNVLNGPMKPTPNKSHYTFNLRDISKIFQGVVSANVRLTQHPVQLVRLWIHENKRVFGDRLIDDKDRSFLDDMLLDRAQVKFALAKKEIFNAERIIFGDFMDGIDVENRVYRQIEDLRKFQDKIEDYLQEYNGQVKQVMNLVMFLDACDHVSRIQRIIRQPLGNGFLLGVGGSGRQSLSRLATFIANYRIYQIEVIKGYNMLNWREDVKKVLMQAGVENKQTSFLFVDTQIIKDQQLEDINNILNGGDVPNLYKIEDMEGINKVGRQMCMEKNIQITKMNMFSQYLTRIQKNIHMIIAMSPLGEIFRARIRQFPSLVTCCTIDWFTEWPEEALLGVGRGQIIAADLDLGKDLDSCVEIFKFIHQSVEQISIRFAEELNRKNYVTPTSFLEQLNLYKEILLSKRKETINARDRLVKGLKVLDEAAIAIAALKRQIDEKTPELEKTKFELSKTMAIIAKEKADADVERSIVAKDEASARQQEAEATTMKAEAQQQLDEAIPMLEEVMRVLKDIKREDFDNIKTFKAPHPVCVLCMELACHMFQKKASKKNIAKNVANDTNGYFDFARTELINKPQEFINGMITFDKENMPESLVKKVSAVLARPELANEAAIKQVSEALVGIVKWSSSMMKYHELLKVVNPKREKVAQMNATLEVVRANLAAKMAQLAEVDAKVAKLEESQASMLDKERRLNAEIEVCNKKLERASKIITGLDGEKVRWTETVARYGDDLEYLVGNCLIAAGMVTYSGPFIAQFRAAMETEWYTKIDSLGIKIKPNISMKALMEDPVQTKVWTAASLPNDNLSIENAIIMFKSRRWPLMIDPQNQANKFIKNLAKDDDTINLNCYKQSDGNLLRNLEIAIQNGSWVLIENVGEELDPALEPILQKQVDRSGNLRLGEKSIPYNNAFRFFMTTTIPNPHYSPETQVKVTILNFAITPFGLEEQMLNQFIMQELPELQKKKDAIVQQNAQSAKALRDIEEKILNGLTKHKEISAILETDELIIVLDESKITSDEIKVRLADAAETEKIIDATREKFRPVAFRAQVLFFTIVDLAVIDPMYQYSLQWFSQLFGNSVEHSHKSSDDQVRIKNLNDHFTLSLYENICRSLFEKHKNLFSFKLTVNILFGENKMDASELRYFLAGPSGEIPDYPNPTDWLGNLEWRETYKQIYMASKSLPAFEGLDKFLIENSDSFRPIFDSQEPQNCALPGDWETKLNSFQKMIVLKSLRMDKIIPATQNFIIENLGQAFVEPPTFELAKSFKESSITTPLIFVLSTGSDPVEFFNRFAEEMNMTKKVDSISLGRGQGKKAEDMIMQSLSRGGWVLLMNCHLAVSWMPRLEQIVETMDDTKHRDFRLWLTSMPNNQFPVSVLQNSVKMTLEPPSGLKQNVLGTYQAMDERELEDCTKPETYKRLLFGFCFFHAIVQDRRKFGPIGWNIQYAFTNEDLSVSRRQLKIFIEEYEQIPYKVLNYIGAEINYGGRVTDDKDVRLIKTILETYVNPNIMIDGFPFSKSGIYRSVAPGEKEDYLDYIRSLPLNPEPEAFGLHSNAEITTSQISTTQLLEDMISMQPRTSTGKGKSREEIIREQAKYLQGKAPEVFDLEMIGKAYPTSYTESMNTVLFQECVRYNRMLAEMKVSLIAVQKALVGEVVMSEDLEMMATSIYDNMVPKIWSEKGFLSMKPLASWIIDCNDRINFLNNWYQNGTPNVYWISGFFFPQAFLTATLQNYARKHVMAIDTINFSYKIVDDRTFEDVTEKPELGCLIYGMYLEGCRWDYQAHQLAESEPKQLFTELPMVHLVPVQNRKTPTTGIYNSPMYKVLSRTGTLSTTGHSTNFVIFMELPSSEEESLWIKAGVAIFLALKF